MREKDRELRRRRQRRKKRLRERRREQLSRAQTAPKASKRRAQPAAAEPEAAKKTAAKKAPAKKTAAKKAAAKKTAAKKAPAKKAAAKKTAAKKAPAKKAAAKKAPAKKAARQEGAGQEGGGEEDHRRRWRSRQELIRAPPAPSPQQPSPPAADRAPRRQTMFGTRTLAETDPQIAAAIDAELRRQNDGLELIASENFASRAVREAAASVMTNKYAEGYPGKRYYGGCEFVDDAERLARDRARELFGAEHVNVQPHSGTQANMAVYFAVLEPGDTLMGMDLSCGGHLTHGHHLSYSGRDFNVVAYGVDRESETIDYDEVAELAREHRPKLIVCGASAYSRVIDFARFREIADEVGALLMADIAHIAGLVAAGLHPSPVPHCQFVTSTTHKTLRGPRGGIILCTKKWRKKIDRALFPGIQGGPLMHIIAAKAVAFGEALEPEFKDYQQRVVANARRLADSLAAAATGSSRAAPTTTSSCSTWPPPDRVARG